MSDVDTDERRWFARNPDRTYRVRLANPDEIEGLREHGCFADGIAIPPGCFIYAMFHIDRGTTMLDGRLVVLEAGPSWDESSCRKAWQDCEKAERMLQ
jgi:hypothetical protein